MDLSNINTIKAHGDFWDFLADHVMKMHTRAQRWIGKEDLFTGSEDDFAPISKNIHELDDLIRPTPYSLASKSYTLIITFITVCIVLSCMCNVPRTISHVHHNKLDGFFA